MNRTRRLLMIFGLVCMAQLALPAYTILREERLIRHGELYRFRCEAVDPVDLFRGRYVVLGFAERNLTTDADPAFSPGESIYVNLEHGTDGYARISAPSRTRPGRGEYLEVRVEWQSDDQVSVDLPFSRYYVEESLAQEAERAYLELTRRDDVDVFATVRVLDGRGALEDLYLDQLPLKEFLAGAGGR